MFKFLPARRAIQAALVGIALMAGLLFAPTAASAADSTTPCTNWSAWYTLGNNWGAARFCYWIDPVWSDVYWRWQVQDTLTDGYAVHLEACTDWLTDPYTCHNPLGQEDPVFGDRVYIGPPGANQYCMQSTGPVVTSGWPANLTKLNTVDPAHSRYSVRVVRGRSCGGAHQLISWFDLWLSN